MNFKIVEITEGQYLRLSRLVSNKFGIKLPADKRIMFQSRLQPRLRQLELDSFEAYCDYVFKGGNEAEELSAMIDFISTNKTDFFREKEHFDLLLNELLPQIVNSSSKAQDRFFRCWSAGCSNGQEAFSLAMTFEEFRQNRNQAVDYHIVGTDVSDKMLQVASKGIYPFSQSEKIPGGYLKKYVMKSTDPEVSRIKIMKFIQAKVDFRYSNLMDEKYNIPKMFRFIFIRNTLIYFNYENQYRILKKVINHLVPGGYLFIGHSESLINLDLPIQIVSPSVYQKINTNHEHR